MTGLGTYIMTRKYRGSSILVDLERSMRSVYNKGKKKHSTWSYYSIKKNHADFEDGGN